MSLVNLMGSAGGSSDKIYVEDVFSTYLYTGNGSTQTISNGIDLAGKGGLVWQKNRSAAGSHFIYDTVRGVNQYLSSNTTNASANYNSSLTAFNSNGFTIDFNLSNSGETDATWTFRKQPKFFDVVTYTGNGSTSQSIAHNLGSAPGCMIIKSTNLTGHWYVYHRSLGYTQSTYLNLTNAADVAGVQFGGAAPTSTAFTVGYSVSDAGPNVNGRTYVAYIFAHDAGGFGLTGTDNVISCGSFTTDGSANATVDLGWEPQLVIAKRSSNTGAWCIQDNMRGFTAKPTSYTANPILFANSSDQEITGGANTLQMTATGFTTDNVSYNASSTYIYIAIRRGPMKVPTDGTKVFNPTFSYNVNNTVRGYLGAPADMELLGLRYGSDVNAINRSRLVGGANYLITSNTDAEGASSGNYWDNMLGYQYDGSTYSPNTTQINYVFRRAPGFFDEVCYTGTGTFGSKNHNLGVVPELVINKGRSGVTVWYVWQPGSLPAVGQLQSTAAFSVGDIGAATATSTTFKPAFDSTGGGYVAYLFASCPGVSKVGTYTGNGSSQTINCGFSAGARFFLVKASSTTGSWWVFDSVRGILASTDFALQLNSTAAEITSADAVDPASEGIIVNQEATCSINANGVQYVFLAIA